ncbi:UbiA prenyltransferase family protein [Haliea atlantica]|nr:4-hydroxybenzoate octaprenyltransferase [Haliea sp.]MAL94938.1 4-hydroxybenzoate octaprenyltransferase [Haliea sp.]|tara:strand:- start:462 stop:1331 length:870 start_codon:yes stop_codon:yes gene_type:complete
MSRAIDVKALLALIRFDKPIGTLLLLWPTLTALWIAADGVPSPKLLLIFILGTFLMRSAGCIVNDLADRHLDGGVKRTQGRPLVTGQVSVLQARVLFVVLCLAAFGLVLLTNALTVLLSVFGLLLAATYPFMKRFTHWPQVVLGAAFSWAIPMAFAAQQAELPSALWLLYVANLLWTVVYDTEYAMVDRDDDLKIGIKSTAVLFGEADRLVIGALQGLTVLAWLLAGQRFGLGAPWFLAVAAAACLFAWHQVMIRERQREACFRAFRHNNWVGLLLYLGAVAHFALQGH